MNMQIWKYSVLLLTAAGSFLSAAFHILLSFPLVLAFPLFAAACLVPRGSRFSLPPPTPPDSEPWLVRFVIVLGVAFAMTWWGIAWNVDSVSIPGEDWDLWLEQHGASREYFGTLMVTGFPIQRIEGHGGGGAQEYLPWSKGLWALLANFAIWMGVGIGLAAVATKKAARFIAWSTVAASFAFGIPGFLRLGGMLD